MPPAAVDILPRHLQGSASTSSSSNPSPTGTPPVSASPAASAPFAVNNPHQRTPSTSNVPLPSPSNNPPGSPSTSNRFGLNLGFIQRRPRGWTTSSAQRSPGGRGGAGGSPATSPAAELPPSPGGGERSGYGFPALRRSLSKRASSHGGDGSRPRARRSSSQPPAPFGLDAGSAGSGGEGPSRPASGNSAAAAPAASGSGSTPQPQAQPNMTGSSALTSTTSLPNPPNRSSTLPPSRSATGETSTGSADGSGTTHKLRLVPHLESSRSLHFDPIERDLAPSAIVRVGRFTDRHGGSSNASQGTPQDPARVAFKSKVVSRGHAEIWVDDGGKFFIRDTKSSSGTFLNHIRLAGPNVESRPFNLKDGDVLQLGVDYQGGTEEIYRCVKMRVELNRGWQRGANNFNTAALAQLRALGASPMDPSPTGGSALTAAPSTANATPTPSTTTGGAATAAKPAPSPASAAQQAAQAASITDCCICLYPVTVCQALFIAPCSHVTHFKCIRPLVEQNYPGFCCPLCRTYANLEADVEIDLPEPEPSSPLPVDEPSSSGLGLLGVSREPDMDAVEEVDEPASRAPSIRSPTASRPSGSRRSSVAALTTALGEASIGRNGAGGGRSRPASIAPSVREREEGGEEGREGLADAQEEEERDDEMDVEESTEEDVASSLQPAPPIPHLSPASPDRPSSSAFSSPLAIGGSSSSPSHLAPPSEDLYASLASAATPPNNTFLSTLAESGLTSLPGATFFAPQRPTAQGPPSSGAAGMGSLDAAVLGESTGPSAAAGGSAGAGPSRISVVTSASATTNSGEGASDGDEEGSVGGSGGDGEVDDAETQEANSQEGGDAQPPSPSSPGGGSGSAVKGKGKEKASEEVEFSPPTKEATSSSPASSPTKGKKGKERVNDHHTDPAIAAAALIF